MVSRIEKAQKAFKKGDSEASKKAHEKKEFELHDHEDRPFSGKYLGNAVYGAIDGIVTTFAVVSGVVGADLSPSIILILGFANLLGDGFSMAAGNYLSEKSELDYEKLEYERELWEVENYPKGEIEEIRHIYEDKGFHGKDLDRAVEIITSDKDRWVKTMMIEELGIIESDKNPLTGALVTFGSFLICGFLPLLTFVLLYFFPSLQSHSFLYSCIITALTIFGVGSLRSLIIAKRWYIAGLEMLLVGGSAAIVAYIVGYLLKGLA